VAEFGLPLVRGTVGGRSILEGRPIQVADVQAAADEFPESTENAWRTGFRTILSVPLMREGVAIGAIVLRRTEVQLFSERQLALLQTFADQAVIAIENVRLFKELEARNRDLTTALDQQTATAEILRVISSSPTDLQPVFDAIVDSAARLCQAAFGTLHRFDSQALTFEAQHGMREAQLEQARHTFPQPAGRHMAVGRAVLDRRVAHIHDIREDQEYLVRSHQEDYRTVLAVPLMREGVPVGALGLWRREVRPFSDQQIELVKTFADQAVIAIENVRLFKELEARNKDLTRMLEQQTATGEILNVISGSPTDEKPVFQAIADSSVRLCAASFAVVATFDGEMLHLVAHKHVSAAGDRTLAAAYPMRPNRGQMAGRAILEERVVHVADVTLDHEYVGASLGNRATLSVPLLRKGDAIGTITIARFEPLPFTDQQVELLKTFADQAVIAIENVRLFKELQERTQQLSRSVDQLTALGEVGHAVSSTLDLETVLTTIVSRAVQLSGLDGGVVFEYDEEAEEFVQRVATETGGALAEARRTTRIRKGEGVLGRTAVTLEPVQVPDIAMPGAYEGRLRENLVESGIRAILAVPMVREGRLIGCLAVTRNQPGAFPVETIDLLRTFATQSALAIQNARLFREIEEKSRQLEVASQHKSEFLANMSHELRTPLNAIIGFSEVLTDRMFGELNEKQEEYLKDIYASGTHLLSLINDILDLSKIEAGRMELELTDFDLPTAIENALMLVRERAGRRSIALHTTIDSRLGQIQADERKVRQVVLNLLSNAIKFTPEGGRIDVGAVPKDGFVEVSVSDTGIGIAPEDQEKVFEEFRQVGTAAKKIEGTGLGLTLCRKFVELHGGRIWVKSEVGVGSTFTFTIPVRPGE